MGAGWPKELRVPQRLQQRRGSVAQEAVVAGFEIQCVRPVDELVRAVPERVATGGREKVTKVGRRIWRRYALRRWSGGREILERRRLADVRPFIGVDLLRYASNPDRVLPNQLQ